MPRSDDEQTVAEDMYRYFGKEWAGKIQDALRQRPDVAKNRIANLMTDAYLCGVRDGDGFGLRGVVREIKQKNASAIGEVAIGELEKP